MLETMYAAPGDRGSRGHPGSTCTAEVIVIDGLRRARPAARAHQSGNPRPRGRGEDRGGMPVGAGHLRRGAARGEGARALARPPGRPQRDRVRATSSRCVIQHEMDHLEGRLFVDYLSDLKRERIRKKLDKERKEQRRHAGPRGIGRRAPRVLTLLRRLRRQLRASQLPALEALCAAHGVAGVLDPRPDRPQGRGRKLIAGPREERGARARHPVRAARDAARGIRAGRPRGLETPRRFIVVAYGLLPFPRPCCCVCRATAASTCTPSLLPRWRSAAWLRARSSRATPRPASASMQNGGGTGYPAPCS